MTARLLSVLPVVAHWVRFWIVVGLLLALALASGCGGVTAATSDGASDQQVTDATKESSPDAAPADAPAADVVPDASGNDAHDAPACAQWPNGSPPYCASCRCANGVVGAGCCACGALPCCDPACQS